jgi:hypothetical protein
MIRREDFLISVCFAEAPDSAEAQAYLRDFAKQLNAAWRYWEILLVMDASDDVDLEKLLEDIPNLRLLKTRGMSQVYRRRVIGASEAIGDLVVLSAIEELPHLDITEMLIQAGETDTVVVARRDERRLLLDGMLNLLGRSSGFRVQARDMQTAVLPRTLLNRLLARADRQLALRFIPRDSGLPVRYYHLADGAQPTRAAGLGRRLGILQKLLVHSAPSVLGSVSLLAILMSLGGFAFAAYAFCVWLVMENVQPGWFTTSLAISLTASFLGVAIFGLAAGMLNLIDLLTPDALDDVVDERSNADLFSRVAQDLNIETTDDDGPPTI